tara:strand:+ start:2704 stop:4158 length:1455 start_codon:yes stop_codon:yes gene_type:complete
MEVCGAMDGIDVASFRYEASWDSIRSHYEVPAWFRDAKFGIFIHWGLYAVPAFMSEKYAPGMYDPGWNKGGMNAYRHHEEQYGGAAAFGYKDFIPLFRAENFDAEGWADLFKRSGARYVVPVAEHHDGFAMYASRVTRWNAKDMGPKRDVMRLLADACRARDMKFGVSSHFALNRIYYKTTNPDWDTNDTQYADLYWFQVDKESKLSQLFLDLWWNRTTDIMDQYEPDLIWFDYGLDKPGWESVHQRLLAYYYNRGLDWNKEVVFQDKNMRSRCFPEDLIVLDIERGRMTDIYEFPWQTDTSVGKISWGYIENEQYKSTDYLIDELIDIVSKNGCLLLNIGPRADGTIPAEAVTILEEIGAWLALNGEAVYDTRPWVVYGEGPTEVNQGHHSEKKNKDAGHEDIRFTMKGDQLYATALGWPDDGVFTVETLRRGSPELERSIRSVELISGSNRVEWKQTSECLRIEVGGRAPCAAAIAFRITFD